MSRGMTWTLDEVVALLNEHHQRATYGAIAKVVKRSPRTKAAQAAKSKLRSVGLD